MELGKIIAKNLSDLRNARHLTLGQLSKLSGISKAMLSEIEKGDSNPTINTIWKIAHGLDVPYTKLIDDVEKEAALIRKPQNPMQIGETEAYYFYAGMPVLTKNAFGKGFGYYVAAQSNDEFYRMYLGEICREAGGKVS